MRVVKVAVIIVNVSLRVAVVVGVDAVSMSSWVQVRASCVIRGGWGPRQQCRFPSLANRKISKQYIIIT